MGQGVSAFLKASLPANLYTRLEKASQNWTKPIFARDPETGAYECLHDRLLAGDEDTELIDAVCMACELLSSAAGDFAHDKAIEREPDPSGSVRLEYRFRLEDEAIYEAVRERLEDLAAGDAGIRVNFQKYPWGNLAIVTVHYAHTFDYQRKKDAIDWVLQIARMQTKDVPFKGTRI